jgi:hypothetical protein
MMVVPGKVRRLVIGLLMVPEKMLEEGWPRASWACTSERKQAG